MGLRPAGSGSLGQGGLLGTAPANLMIAPRQASHWFESKLMMLNGGRTTWLFWSSTVALLSALSCGDDSVRLGSARSPDRGQAGNDAAAGVGGGSPDGGTGFGATAGDRAAAGSCSTGDAAWCAEEQTRHGNWRADVIAIVDTSQSMAAEVVEVQAALNGFAARIQAARIDLRLALLAAPPAAGQSGPSICVPPPLGSGSCPPQGDDTIFPQLFHHPSAVLDQRSDVPAVLRFASSDLAQFLRPDVKTSMVIVSDGNDPSDLPAAFWNNQLVPTYNQTQVSAIYAFSPCISARAEGTEYRRLVLATGGAEGDLCAEPIASVLDRVAEDIVVQQICETTLPASVRLPTGVRVVLTTNGASVELDRVSSADQCDAQRGGWYEISTYPQGRARRLCPASCEAFRSDPSGIVSTQLACDVVQPPC